VLKREDLKTAQELLRDLDRLQAELTVFKRPSSITVMAELADAPDRLMKALFLTSVSATTAAARFYATDLGVIRPIAAICIPIIEQQIEAIVDRLATMGVSAE
jgi:hypothetical protein